MQQAFLTLFMLASTIVASPVPQTASSTIAAPVSTGVPAVAGAAAVKAAPGVETNIAAAGLNTEQKTHLRNCGGYYGGGLGGIGYGGIGGIGYGGIGGGIAGGIGIGGGIGGGIAGGLGGIGGLGGGLGGIGGIGGGISGGIGGGISVSGGIGGGLGGFVLAKDQAKDKKSKRQVLVGEEPEFDLEDDEDALDLPLETNEADPIVLAGADISDLLASDLIDSGRLA